MREYFCLLLILAMLSGCVSAPKIPPATVFSSMRKIIIIPVEPPPLTVGPGGWFETDDESDQSDEVGRSEEVEQSDDSFIGSVSHPVAAAGLAAILIVANGIAWLINHPKAKKLKAECKEDIDKWYSSDQIWIPTRVLAEEAASQIASEGSYESVVSEKMYSPPSLKKRKTTWHMENWYRPLRGWYNQDFSVLDLEECKRQGADAVLEVGIINYEIDGQGNFILQVFIKLSSATTGQVVGRAKSIAFLKAGSPQKIFENQAETFKNFFEEEGGKLLKEDLQTIGLLPLGS